MIITKRTLFLFAALILLVALALAAPGLYDKALRTLHGVKAGVTLEGQLVEGLLKQELYDVVASLAESSYVEASNASCNWQTGEITPEVVGQVVDVQGTVDALLAAPAETSVELVTVLVLPSITSAHFEPIYRGPTSEPRVALMVNVDWGDEYIPGMLDVFRHYGVSATWFPTGRWTQTSRDLARTISQAGHEIGNHGGWHGEASKMSRSETARLIQEGEDLILEATGQRPTVFAPPSGDFNQQTVSVAAELGYKTVLWTVDTVDWQRPAPTVIIDRVIGKVKNGALVLMHPTKPTLEALPVILDHLANMGYQCVTVTELLAD
ncbi:MAG: polysaccharide deacetylase family protein [Bacillota bacterium]|nr:polysaccharide deacetylase family protein [Bacillota bacterium]HHT91410.1 polysaccharide deacetylase family protein [Bacillota bacterium]